MATELNEISERRKAENENSFRESGIETLRVLGMRFSYVFVIITARIMSFLVCVNVFLIWINV